MIAAIQITESASRKVLPKYGMTLDEVGFAVGSKDLAARMRKAGWITPKFKNIYDAAEVAKGWSRILQGEQP